MFLIFRKTLNFKQFVFLTGKHLTIKYIFRYVKPRTIEELRQGMPATSKEIEDEIIKQQNLLEYLHEHVFI